MKHRKKFLYSMVKEEQRELQDIDSELSTLDSKVEAMDKEIAELKQVVSQCISSVEEDNHQQLNKIKDKFMVGVGLIIVFNFITCLAAVAVLLRYS